MTALTKFIRLYKKFAVVLLNTFILFLVINLALGIFFAVKDKRFLAGKNSKLQYIENAEKSDNFSLNLVYPDLSREEINALLRETWTRTLSYEPFTQFKESARKGTYVNVDKNGFRLSKNQGPWPPDKNNLNIFIFGGSTTFNYGVSDNQTIASYFQDALQKAYPNKTIKVYNFGRGYYYSTQEQILFQRLLASEFIPHYAIFIDGLNENLGLNDEPYFTKRLKEFIRGDTCQECVRTRLLDKLPLVKLIKTLKNSRQKEPQQISLAELFSQNKNSQEKLADKDRVIKQILDRYLNNKEIISAVAKVVNTRVIFVWQPVPYYKYDLRYYPFEKEFSSAKITRLTYPVLKDLSSQTDLGKNFIWCADIQEGIKDLLYVDETHYNAKMSKKIAEYIVSAMKQRELF